MQTVKIRTSQNIEIDYEVAGLGERVLARVVDIGVFTGLFYLIYMIILFFYLSQIEKLQSGNGVPVFLIVLGIIYGVIFIFYDLVAEIFFNGQSIGKFAIKIKVVNIDGARPTISQYFIRWVFRLLDFGITFGFGAVISVAVSEKKQRIGDIIAGTTLIKTKPRTTLDELFLNSTDDSYEPVFPGVGTLTDSDITLVHEVISNFKSTGNSRLVYNMALKVKEHLGVVIPPGMNDFDFLQAVIKDYSYVTSRTGV
ncbi:MAG TPA: RDD family protein [Mucilaginibacter sp.]